MEFKIITDVDKAKEVWDLLSPHKVIDDEWDFRYAFIKFLPYKLYFIAWYEDGNPISLLPLQENNGIGLMPPYKKRRSMFYEFFGGDDTDDNTIFGNPKVDIGTFSQNLEHPLFLAPLSRNAKIKNTSFYENKFYLPLTSYDSYVDFLKDRWRKSSRKKILQQIRRLYKEHTISVIENDLDDLKLLAEFNKKRFGNQSSFSYSYRTKIFYELAEKFHPVLLTVIVDGNKEAVSFGLKYKDSYVGMNAGVNNKIPDLAKLLIMLQVDKAITLGCELYDAGKGDSGWKEAYKLDKVPQFKTVL